jgi:hypothetical protein
VADSLTFAQNIPSFVRFCRDYSIADLFFVIFAAISGAYVISNNTSIRTGLCEDVSSQPDFIRDLADMGFNLENCEVWFERAVIGLMTLSAAVIIIRVSRIIFVVRIPKDSQRRWLPSFRAAGPLCDRHLQLLLATLPLSIVVNVDDVYTVTSDGERIAPSYLSFANPEQPGTVTLCGREA